MDLTIGTLEQTEVEASARLKSQAFTVGVGPFDQDRPNVPLDRTIVARSGGHIVATLSVYPFGQWFGGRSVPMGGVAGVAVTPEARGQGLARRLLGESIRAMRDRGEAISALYPTTSTLYRSMGYEFAGRFERTTVDITTIAEASRSQIAAPADSRPLNIRPVQGAEVDLMRPVYDALACESHGWLDRGDLFWNRIGYDIDPTRSNSFGYVLVDDAGDVQAGLTVSHRRGDGNMKFGLDVGGPFATSPSALAQALSLVAAMGTTADRATLSLPVEPLALALPTAYLDHQDSWVWMLRIVDVGKAMTDRGYNPMISADLQFSLTDEQGPWNDGLWSLTVAGGQATVDRLDETSAAQERTLALDIQTLSCLYTGFISPADLARAGRLPGADRPTMDALAAIFAGPSARVVDFF